MADPSQAKYPVSVLAGPYGHPFHPLLVTVPVGAWFASLVFDLASRRVPDPAFLVRSSMWLIAIGLIGAAAAALAGFLDLAAIPAGTRARRMALVHMTLNITVTVAYLADWLVRRAVLRPPDRVPPALIVLSAVNFTVLAISGYLGGRLAYRYGVRVATETTQASGFLLTRRARSAGAAATHQRPANRPGPPVQGPWN
ncbi:MAG TPA: DUF2231 domain-containing protein [Streptosporangiaceae bacterium]